MPKVFIYYSNQPKGVLFVSQLLLLNSHFLSSNQLDWLITPAEKSWSETTEKCQNLSQNISWIELVLYCS